MRGDTAVTVMEMVKGDYIYTTMSGIYRRVNDQKRHFPVLRFN